MCVLGGTDGAKNILRQTDWAQHATITLERCDAHTSSSVCLLQLRALVAPVSSRRHGGCLPHRRGDCDGHRPGIWHVSRAGGVWTSGRQEYGHISKSERGRSKGKQGCWPQRIMLTRDPFLCFRWSVDSNSIWFMDLLRSHARSALRRGEFFGQRSVAMG
jgi:hypothetical protein